MSEENNNVQKAVTCRAGINMALIKYWGKKDSVLHIPLNASLSLTWHADCLGTVTTVSRIAGSRAILTMNGTTIGGKEESKMLGFMGLVMKTLTELMPESTAMQIILHDNLHWQVDTMNIGPTAAGLASSASGFAALAGAMAFYCGCTDLVTISELARQGSGSACRSVHGGVVKWEDKRAQPVTIQPELKASLCMAVFVVNAKEKTIGSREGMALSVETCSWLHYRAKEVVPKRMARLESALSAGDWKVIVECTIQDSNELHAVCMSTYPPILYLEDTTLQLMRNCEAYNADKRTKGEFEQMIAYTIDAGPNVCFVASSTANLEYFLAFISESNPERNPSVMWHDPLEYLHDKERYRPPMGVSAVYVSPLGNDLVLTTVNP
jgi:diphosphomevalonate decarboxylase